MQFFIRLYKFLLLFLQGEKTPASSTPPPVEDEPAPDELDTPQETKSIPPVYRGGSRGPKNKLGNTNSPSINQKPKKPRILCKNVGGMWQIEVEEEGEDRVKTEEIEEVRDLCEFTHNALISFKLYRKEDSGFYKKPSSHGEYVIFAPQEWQHTERQDRHDGSIYENYHVHRFWLPEDSNAGLRYRDMAYLLGESSRFSFEGKKANGRIKDNLFLENPPVLTDSKYWQGITEVVVREEKSNGLKVSYNPWSKELKNVLSKRLGGQFSVLVYSGNQLQDSMDFKFVRGLRDIQSEIYRLPLNDSCTPPAKIIFKGSLEVKAPDDIRMENDGESIKAIADNRQVLESLSFTLKNDDDCVEVTMDSDPIWWKLGNEHESPTNWEGKSYNLKREHFNRAASEEGLWLKVPQALRRRGIKITAGFSEDNMRRCSKECYKNENKLLFFRFGDFCDDPAIINSDAEEEFKVVLEINNKSDKREETTALIVSANERAIPLEVGSMINKKMTEGRCKRMARNQIRRDRKRGKLNDIEDFLLYKKMLVKEYLRKYGNRRNIKKHVQ